MITLENTEGIYVLRMDNDENRMNQEWLDSFNSALDQADAADDLVALVTTGSGKFFSNGLDLDWLMSGDVDMPGFVAEAERLLARVLAAPYITVAACNGHTFAAGAMLALCHDFRIMRADRGFFCLPEVNIGIPFTPGMNSLIVSRMPLTTSHQVMVTGQRLGGIEAQELGIMHQAVPEDEVLPAAVELGKQLGGKDRNTLATIKERMLEETIRLLRNSAGTQPS